MLKFVANDCNKATRCWCFWAHSHTHTRSPNVRCISGPANACSNIAWKMFIRCTFHSTLLALPLIIIIRPVKIIKQKSFRAGSPTAEGIGRARCHHGFRASANDYYYYFVRIIWVGFEQPHRTHTHTHTIRQFVRICNLFRFSFCHLFLLIDFPLCSFAVVRLHDIMSFVLCIRCVERSLRTQFVESN